MSQEKYDESLIFALEILAKSSTPVSKVEIIRAHKGDTHRILQVLRDLVEDECVMPIPQVRTSKRGRPAEMLKLTSTGKSRLKSLVTKRAQERRAFTLALKATKWRHVPIRFEESRPEKKAFSGDPSMALSLGTFVVCSYVTDDYVPLENVLAKAPLSWDAYPRYTILEVVRTAWLHYGLVECAPGLEGQWKIKSSIKMQDEVELLGRASYKKDAKTRYPGWKW